jgi:hypothetical protein
MAEQIPSDHVGLNLKHFRYLEVLLIGVAETLKADTGKLGTREAAEIAGIIEKCQRGRRLARGLSAGGEAEEEVRARAEAENRAVEQPPVHVHQQVHAASEEGRRHPERTGLVRLELEVAAFLHLFRRIGAAPPSTLLRSR